MSLNPQVETLLAGLAQMPAIDFERVSAPELRAAMDGPSMFAPGDEVATVESREIPGPGGTLRLRLYRPAGKARAGWPAVLYLHGGGFVIGTLDTHDNICRCLAARTPCVVVSVDYRRAPEAPFPAAAEDAASAMDWLRRHATELGLDRRRIAVAGDSAGGNLAAGLAAREAAAGRPLSLELLYYPMTDCASSYGDGGLFLTREMMAWFLAQYLPDKARSTDPLASPLHGVGPDARGRRVRMMLAECDLLRPEAEAYAQRMRSAGADVGTRVWQGQIHGFASMLGVLDDAGLALDHGADALREAFATGEVNGHG